MTVLSAFVSLVGDAGVEVSYKLDLGRGVKH